MAFLAAFFAFFAMCNHPLQVGLVRKVCAAPPRRFCRLALSPRVPAPSRFVARCYGAARDVFALWAKGSEKRWGSAWKATAPLQSGLSYFFFAFLAFLAAFFAFLAIVPPEGVQLCLMATQARGH